MSTAPGRPRAGQARGVVKIRLAGSLPDLALLAALVGALPAVEILTGPDDPYPNRRDAGERVYLTVRVHLPCAAQRRGASTQPVGDLLAVPRRRHLP